MSRRGDFQGTLSALNDAVTLTGADAMAFTEWALYVEFNHTAAAGTILLETASVSSYAGTWATLATVTFSAIDKCHYVSVTGVNRAIRARVSSAVTSGSALVTIIGNMA
jgi:hypothetical protein